MRPVVLTVAGVALGIAMVLPAARAQLVPAAAPMTVLVAPPVVGAPTVTVTGPAVATRYGPVQVRVSVTGDRLTSATAVRLPDGDGESRSINRQAGPLLDVRAVSSQGRVDTVSGASYTSDGYRRSLQAALDTARATVLAAVSIPAGST